MALSTNFSILNTIHQLREPSMLFRSYCFKSTDPQLPSHPPPYDHYAHLSERDNTLEKLQQMLQLLCREIKSQMSTLPKDFPAYYLEQRNPLAFLIHISYVIKHHHRPRLHALYELNGRLRFLRTPVTHRFLMNKITQLARRVHNDQAEVILFLRALEATKYHNSSASQSKNAPPSAQQVVTDFFHRRMQHHDVMQCRESQIIFDRVRNMQTVTSLEI